MEDELRLLRPNRAVRVQRLGCGGRHRGVVVSFIHPEAAGFGRAPSADEGALSLSLSLSICELKGSVRD